MRRGHGGVRRAGRAIAPRLGLALLAALASWALPAEASAGASTKLVRYHGYALVVPARWPVYDLSADPRVCVRFDRHALYLGRPSAEQRCPAHAAGRTEAILLEPLTAHGAGAGAGGGAGGAVLPGAPGTGGAGGPGPPSAGGQGSL
ncbi:MAG: hypothetical protein JO169_13005, partial [Solirubrobacterales bacterium]|nr:hypothetical protein [Solirubrobacterales bacterium]